MINLRKEQKLTVENKFLPNKSNIESNSKVHQFNIQSYNSLLLNLLNMNAYTLTNHTSDLIGVLIESRRPNPTVCFSE